MDSMLADVCCFTDESAFHLSTRRRARSTRAFSAARWSCGSVAERLADVEVVAGCTGPRAAVPVGDATWAAAVNVSAKNSGTIRAITQVRCCCTGEGIAG